MSEESPYKNRGSDLWAKGYYDSDFRFKNFLEKCKISDETEKPKYAPVVKDPKQVIGVAVFGGLGRAGFIHLTNILNERRLRLLYIVEERVEDCKKVLSGWHVTGVQTVPFDQAHTVYNDDRVNMVIVATPTFLHEQIVVNALEHGKAVFCEKPIAATQEATENCYKMAEKNNLPLLSAFNRRFDPGFSSIQRRVHSGEIGQVQIVKTTSRDSPLPIIDYLAISATGQGLDGIYSDCAIHDIDLVCWMVGEFPTRVYTSAHANIPEIRQINDIDTVAIVLTFNSGALGVIDLCRNSVYGYDQRIEVFGTKGMLKCENEIPFQVTEFKSEGTKTAPILYSFPSRYFDSYRVELEHFVDVLQGRDKLSVTKEQGLAACRVAAACGESLLTKNAVELFWQD